MLVAYIAMQCYMCCFRCGVAACGRFYHAECMKSTQEEMQGAFFWWVSLIVCQALCCLLYSKHYIISNAMSALLTAVASQAKATCLLMGLQLQHSSIEFDSIQQHATCPDLFLLLILFCHPGRLLLISLTAAEQPGMWCQRLD